MYGNYCSFGYKYLYNFNSIDFIDLVRLKFQRDKYLDVKYLLSTLENEVYLIVLVSNRVFQRYLFRCI